METQAWIFMWNFSSRMWWAVSVLRVNWIFWFGKLSKSIQSKSLSLSELYISVTIVPSIKPTRTVVILQSQIYFDNIYQWWWRCIQCLGALLLCSAHAAASLFTGPSWDFLMLFSRLFECTTLKYVQRLSKYLITEFRSQRPKRYMIWSLRVFLLKCKFCSDLNLLLFFQIWALLLEINVKMGFF